jgi:tetratricopeptide (TPR) repeat protein
MPQLTIDQAMRLGLDHHRAGRLQEASEIYRQVLQQKPGHADALHLLGVAAHQEGRLEEAVELIRDAISRNAGVAEYHNNLASVLRDLGHSGDAIDELRAAVRLKPDYFDANYNLSVALREEGRLVEAIAAMQKVVKLKPNYVAAFNSLGNSLRGLMSLDDAIVAYRRAIALQGDLAEAHHNLAMPLLLKGNFREGLPEYEWRWKCKDFLPRPREFPMPRWDGSPLNGQFILLYPEQGFGDTIQFARYAAMVQSRGGKVILEVQPLLRRLFDGFSGAAHVVSSGEPLPKFDTHCPLLSLPLVFQTDLASIPAPVPYIHANAELADQWLARLGGGDDRVKIGIAWAGAAGHGNDRSRSFPLSTFATLAGIPNTVFFSLQKGDPSTQAAQPPPGMTLIDHSPDLVDFADTAALIANLDLVISADTAVVHLAGAMGKPVWVLLPFASDWRWLLDRDDSPWYPTMRLYRQRAPGDWKNLLEKVREDLEKFPGDDDGVFYL